MSLTAKIAAVVTAIGAELKLKADAGDLAAVAFSGSYDDLDDTPEGGGGASENPRLVTAAYTASPGDVVIPAIGGYTITIPDVAEHGDKIMVVTPGRSMANNTTVSYLDITNGATDAVLPRDSFTEFTLRYLKDVELLGNTASGWYATGVSYAES